MSNVRKIIEINEELCTGCGQCILDCAEGALCIQDGKAKVIADILCDGLGACLQGCPTGALRIVEREAPPFDEAAVHARQKGIVGSAPQHSPTFSAAGAETGAATGAAVGLAAAGGKSAPHCGHGCGSAAAAVFNTAQGAAYWPVKLRLLSEHAPFLRGAELVLTADCVPVVCKDFPSVTAGKVVCTVCPKFEDVPQAMEKLQRLAASARCRSVTTLRMEVPCCSGLKTLGDTAADAAGCAVQHRCLSRAGQFMEK